MLETDSMTVIPARLLPLSHTVVTPDVRDMPK